MTSRFNKRYSAEEDAVIRLEYPTVPSQELADRLGRTIRSLQARALKLGVKKKVRSPNAGCFPKGLVPFNKGRRIEE